MDGGRSGVRSDLARVPAGLDLRRDLVPDDASAIARIVASTGFFAEAEIGIAVELVTERLAKGVASGYEFLIAESEGTALGYACWGEIPCTIGNFDLYWIAVAREAQGRGIGTQLLEFIESAVAEAGGRSLYVETSGRPLYEPTRNFYRRHGYETMAVLADFYAPGDGKVILAKRLDRSRLTKRP
jgi:ribosomal protein S18 acetylase RimI-like enzyme